MMKVSPGPVMDEATRAALASGRAEPALGLFIGAVLAMKGISEREGETLAGAALEAEQLAPMSQSALDMALAAIETGGGKAAVRRHAELGHPELASVPDLLKDAILEAESRRAWAHAGPGISRLPLGLGGEAKAEIIRIGAGVAIPWHTHKGQELTLCIHGEFSDAYGVYGPGDFSVFEGAARHQPKAHDLGPVYALAVTDAGLRFEGLLGALQTLFAR